MRIRELVLHHLRTFRTETRISFLDPSTRAVRPVTALAGRDETAKATVLEAIEALLSYAVDPRHPKPLIHEAMAGGLVRMELELTHADLEQFYRQPLPPGSAEPRVLRIEVGRQGVAPLLPMQEWSRFLACLAPSRAADEPFTNAGALSSLLYTAVSRMHRGADLRGGLLYFPGPRAAGVDAAAPAAPSFTFAARGTQPGAASATDGADNAWIVRAPQDGDNRAVEAQAVAAQHNTTWVAAPFAVPVDRDAAAPASSEPVSEDTAAMPIFGVLREQQRPGAVIAIEAPAIPPQPARQRRAIARLRRLAHEWDAQLIFSVHDASVLDAFPESERIALD